MPVQFKPVLHKNNTTTADKKQKVPRSCSCNFKKKQKMPTRTKPLAKQVLALLSAGEWNPPLLASFPKTSDLWPLTSLGGHAQRFTGGVTRHTSKVK